MMGMPDLNNYTVEQLELMNQELMKQRAEITANQRAIAEVLNAKQNRSALTAEIADIERRHGVQLNVVK